MQKYVKEFGLRQLHKEEIGQMTSQGCFSHDWSLVKVTENFSPDNIHNCRFKGNVIIEDNVHIYNIGAYISNMRIGTGACIENTGTIETTESSCSFGIGIRSKVMNENGGRAIPLYPEMSAQTAYIAAIYRDRPKAIDRINEMVDTEYTIPATSDMGYIGQGACICGCGILRNVNIKGNAAVENASILSNVTVVSESGKRTYVGSGVKLYDSVVASGANIDNGSLLERCFVGGAVKISALTAIDSVFFSNSECENGEVVSVFAGPYTVSHHKSTLLIAGMFSFFNAGSGSNMSNHLFKSGAVHQSVSRRGCKMGSSAYMMMPALNGAYTTVIGRHRSHHDTDDFPFSILLETEGESHLIPGINLGNCGTARDILKWMERDKREDSSPDIITFAENNPFIAQKVLKAIEVAEGLLARDNVDFYMYKKVRIKTALLKRGVRSYLMAKDKFIGSILARGKERVKTGFEAADITTGIGPWIDVGGMYMPRQAMEIILDAVENDKGMTMSKVTQMLSAVNENYRHYAYNWALDVLENDLGRKASTDDIAEAVQRGLNAEAKLHKLIEDDMRKERDESFSVGYGLDAADETGRIADYRTVRGIDR